MCQTKLVDMARAHTRKVFQGRSFHLLKKWQSIFETADFLFAFEICGYFAKLHTIVFLLKTNSLTLADSIFSRIFYPTVFASSRFAPFDAMTTLTIFSNSFLLLKGFLERKICSQSSSSLFCLDTRISWCCSLVVKYVCEFLHCQINCTANRYRK